MNVVANFLENTASQPCKVHSYAMVVSPEQAQDWLNNAKYEGQRNPSPIHIARYADDMKAGAFSQGTTITFAVYQGRKHLVNGQHRLHAQVVAKVEMTYTICERYVDSVDQIAIAYGHEDVGRSRSASDLYRPLNLTEELVLTNTQINALNAAVRFIDVGLSPATNYNLTRMEGLRLIRLYAPWAREYFNLIKGAPRSMHSSLKRQSTLAVALLSLRYSSVSAKALRAPNVNDFWEGIATDDGISADDPRKIAGRHLFTTTMSSGSVVPGVVSHASPHYSARYLIQCFNAFMERRAIKKSAKVINDRAPIRMWGVSGNTEEWIK